MLGQGWLDQWERVKRRLDTLRSIYKGRGGGTDAAVDDVQAFFESIHHLKDWIGNDSNTPLTKQDGDDLINSSHALQLSADLANGAKHLALTSTRTGDMSTTIARNDVAIQVGHGTSSHAFYVWSGGKQYDALAVAETAVREWESFLRSKDQI